MTASLEETTPHATELDPETLFLNVDLELRSAEPLDALVKALGPVTVLRFTEQAPYLANLECPQDGPLDVESTLEVLLGLIEALPADARKIWDGCTQRRFDIGLQAGLGPRSFARTISPSVVVRLAAVGAELGLTIYGAQTRATLL